jgi:hypothetical protein
MQKEKYSTTPCYGYVPRIKYEFKDAELFGSEMWKYQILNKVKFWYGTPKPGNDNLKSKIILGIQCVYMDSISGNKKTTEQHCGDLSKEDIEIKELELKEGDFFTNIFIDFDCAITHIKLKTKDNNVIEVGEEKEENKKIVVINTEKNIQMIQTFFGYYDTYGLRALGFKYISRKNFLLINLMGVFRLRHIFKTNEKEREKWKNPDNLKKLNYKMLTVVKVCLLPDKTFFNVIQYC